MAAVLYDLFDRFIVQGVQFGCCPGSFEALQAPYTLRQRTTPMLYGRNMTIVERPEDIGGGHINLRKVYRQAWEATWDADSFMYADMRDFLMTKRAGNESFWLQYDDLMSRQNAYCLCPDNNYTQYLTPTYPIEPFGNTPLDAQSFTNTVYIDGNPQSSGFTIDKEHGVISFGTALTPTNVVTIDYWWNCYVRIAGIDLEPLEYAQQIYVGKVVFAQVNPVYSDMDWAIQIPLNPN